MRIVTRMGTHRLDGGGEVYQRKHTKKATANVVVLGGRFLLSLSLWSLLRVDGVSAQENERHVRMGSSHEKYDVTQLHRDSSYYPFHVPPPLIVDIHREQMQQQEEQLKMEQEQPHARLPSSKKSIRFDEEVDKEYHASMVYRAAVRKLKQKQRVLQFAKESILGSMDHRAEVEKSKQKQRLLEDAVERERPSFDEPDNTPIPDGADEELQNKPIIESVELDGDSNVAFDAVCTEPDDDLDRAIVLAFRGDSGLAFTTAEEEAIQTAFQETYNAQTVNGVNTCDDLLRSINSVLFDPDNEFIVPGRLTTVPDQRRMLGQQHQHQRQLRSHTVNAYALLKKLNVGGKCRGCKEQSPLSLFGGGDDVDVDFRRLQGSSCLCPETSKPNDVATFRNALNARIQALRIGGTVELFEERQCPSEMKQSFSTTFIITPGMANIEDLLPLIGRVEDLILTTYNGLAQQLCDEEYRTITKVEYVPVEGAETLTFMVEGECRGGQCNNSQCLFDAPGDVEDCGQTRRQQRRRTSMLDHPSMDIATPNSTVHFPLETITSSRFLQEDEQEQEVNNTEVNNTTRCFCRAESESGSPQQEDFVEAFEDALVYITDCFESDGSDMAPVYEFCDKFDENEKCCYDGVSVGPGACSNWGNASLTVCKSSCIGLNACANIAGDSENSEEVYVGINGCVGDNSCFNLGLEAAVVTVGDDSCNGPSACLDLGLKSSIVTTNPGSCQGIEACSNLGESTSGSTEVGENACTADRACFECLAKEKTSSLSIPVDAPGCVVPNAVCEYDTAGSFTCVCNNGFSKKEAGKLCEPMDCLEAAEPLDMTEVYTYCDSHPDGEKCCKGLFACANWKTNSSYTVCRGSCRGENACADVAGGGSGGDSNNSKVELGVGSCQGEEACYQLGYNSKTVDLKDDSCVGAGSCFKVGKASKSLKIGKKSCSNGDAPCKMLGEFTTDKIDIADKACNGDVSCSDLAGLSESGKVSIGKGSCVGSSACVKFGYESDEATIEKASCLGEGSCYFVGSKSSGSVKVGSESCEGNGACTSVGGTNSTSEDIIISDTCCQGLQACYLLGDQANEVHLDELSCIGDFSCYSLGALSQGSVTLGSESCLGESVCSFLGEEAHDDIFVGPSSCRGGDRACYNLGNQADSVNIGPGSCINGIEVCASFGAESSGDVVIGSASCLGADRSCYFLGNQAESVTIGPGSCINGTEICASFGVESSGDVVIGSASCLAADRSCYFLGNQAESVTIGAGSCINGTEVCAFLGTESSGDVVIGSASCLGANRSCYFLGNQAESVTIGAGSCVNGTEVCTFLGTESSGDVVIGSESCRGGDAVCKFLGNQADSVTIGAGSCVNATEVCFKVGVESSGDVEIGRASCIGVDACYRAGTESKKTTIGDESCLGEASCIWFGEFAPKEVVVSDGSCLGYWACRDLGYESTKQVVVDTKSCIGYLACKELGAAAGGISVGALSCIGDYACNFLGEDAVKSVEIGEGSCLSYSACYELGDDAKSVTIGDNSCVDDLERDTPGRESGDYVCGYLGVDAEGDVLVSDDSCIGRFACGYAGEYADEDVTILEGSCIGTKACFDLAWVGPSSVFVGEGACKGEEACTYVGEESEGDVTILDGSCIGLNACYDFAEDGAFSVFIGVGSCKGEEACLELGEKAVETVAIGHMSCIGDRSCALVGNVARSVSIGTSSCDISPACFEYEKDNCGTTDSEGLCTFDVSIADDVDFIIP